MEGCCYKLRLFAVHVRMAVCSTFYCDVLFLFSATVIGLLNMIKYLKAALVAELPTAGF